MKIIIIATKLVVKRMTPANGFFDQRIWSHLPLLKAGAGYKVKHITFELFNFDIMWNLLEVQCMSISKF